jgi:hypothetical protein
MSLFQGTAQNLVVHATTCNPLLYNTRPRGNQPIDDACFVGSAKKVMSIKAGRIREELGKDWRKSTVVKSEALVGTR